MKARDIRRALTAKGFQEVNDANHDYFWLHVGGRKTRIFTKISHGATDVHDSLLGQMTRQVRLKRREFDSLIDCRLDGPTYARMLIEREEISVT